MENLWKELDQVPLFFGIKEASLPVMMNCIGFKIEDYSKDDFISIEGERLQYIGIVISGTVDMIKEDFWGNKTILIRMKKGSLFGEAFICGSMDTATVSFRVTEKAKILFLPFKKVLHTCSNSCSFHYQLIENMVKILADKNQELMRKIAVVTKKSLREKILAYLSQQAQLQNNRYITLPLGRIELAEYLCVDRSALTRELSAMKKEGVIDYDKNEFCLKEQDVL